MTLENSMKNAGEMVDEARQGAGKTARRARSTVIDGLHAAASVVTMLRGLGLVDALGWVAPRRRRSTALPIALGVGAGLLAGAAAGVLLAPLAGAETRRRIVDTVANARGEAKRAAGQARDKMSDVVGNGLKRKETRPSP